MTPRRVAYVIESRSVDGGSWTPVAAWWTRALARLDLKERREREWTRYMLLPKIDEVAREFHIVDYRPLDEWAPIALDRGRGDR